MNAAERLSPLEVACGLALGVGPAGPPVRAQGTVRSALAEAILPALRRAPCFVSFSGGRDSSAVLAVATDLARRHGLPLPVPITNRFPEAPKTDETEWQEHVVSHVASDEWLRLAWTDELDLVGPYALKLLSRHGLLWPFNLHFHLPLLEAAAGGSILTGIGGDELLGGSSWARALEVVSGRVRPRPRDALRVGLALSPGLVKRRVIRGRIPLLFDWLQPRPRELVLDTLAAEIASEPLRAGARGAWLRRHRHLSLGIAHFGAVAKAADVLAVHPLADIHVVEAAVSAPELRHHSRTAAMQALFGDVLPPALVERATKSSFDGAFWTGHARARAETWDGTGVDDELVAPDALRREWERETPDGRTYLLLQSIAARTLAAARHEPEAISTSS